MFLFCSACRDSGINDSGDSEWFFGLGSPTIPTAWLSLYRRHLTPSERRLLRGAQEEYGVKKTHPKMPSGPMSSLLSRRQLRPSSAAGNLQSHPCFHSSLYDNVVRPATSVVRGSERDESLAVRRPATHASGPKFHHPRTANSDSKALAAVKKQRRLTIGPTDGIGEDEQIVRPGQQITISSGQNLKGKVRMKKKS